MAKYNTTFNLDLQDMDLIEKALRSATSLDDGRGVCPQAANDLLGRLHDQKVFYRPKSGVYVSG